MRQLRPYRHYRRRSRQGTALSEVPGASAIGLTRAASVTSAAPAAVVGEVRRAWRPSPIKARPHKQKGHPDGWPFRIVCEQGPD